MNICTINRQKFFFVRNEYLKIFENLLGFYNSTFYLLSNPSFAQKNVRSFIFGHSLINHEFQVNPTPSQETSVPHWMHFLAQESDYDYAVGGQYGFLPQHANLPPISQWGFDVVAGAWESDTEPFSAADFTNILITPGNFIQWQGPEENYWGESLSPIDATNTIFEWCNEQEESLDFFIYENWPEMAPYLSNGFPPSSLEWDAYLDYLNGGFHDWFLEYYDSVRSNFPNSCVRMIPVGPVINNLMKLAPFNEIPISELYEDDAPHGRATIYFLASIATYMAMYEEKPSDDYSVDDIIHPIIRDNYTAAVEYIWEQLLIFHGTNGERRVFCSDVISSNQELENDKTEISISPNPSTGILHIRNLKKDFNIIMYNTYGELVLAQNIESKGNQYIDIELIPNGIYHLVVHNKAKAILHSERLIKVGKW